MSRKNINNQEVDHRLVLLDHGRGEIGEAIGGHNVRGRRNGSVDKSQVLSVLYP